MVEAIDITSPVMRRSIRWIGLNFFRLAVVCALRRRNTAVQAAAIVADINV
jgi:hypothetical protein